MVEPQGGKEKRSLPGEAWFFYLLFLIAAAVALWLVPSWKWPVPGKANVHPDRHECPMLREDDDLVHLALRSSKSEATAQFNRWQSCDDEKGTTLIDRAKEAVTYDYVLVGALGLAVFAASLLMRRQKRWRLAADFGLVLALVYASTDFAENSLLRKFLEDQETWSRSLPLLAAVKFGAFIAVLPLVGGALFVVLFGEAPSSDLVSGPRPPGRFWSRWKRRFKRSPGPEPVGIEDRARPSRRNVS